MQGHCGCQETVPKYPCWLDFPWLRPICGCGVEPRLGIKHEPGLLLHWLNSSSLRGCVSCFCYRDLLVHREKSWKVWSDLPSLPLKWGYLSSFHQDHIHWYYNSKSCSDFSALIWFLRARATESSQICLFHLQFFLPCTKCHRFWEALNVWWMFPKAERTPNVLLRQKHFIGVFNFFNEILHQAFG